MFNNKQTLKKIGVFNIFNLKFKKNPTVQSLRRGEILL